MDTKEFKNAAMDALYARALASFKSENPSTAPAVPGSAESDGQTTPEPACKPTEETKKKLSEINKGRKNEKSRKKVLYDGVIYESAEDCAKKLNLNYFLVFVLYNLHHLFVILYYMLLLHQ